jgi:hypothetical protein
LAATAQAYRRIYSKQRMVAMITLLNAAIFRNIMKQHQLRIPDYFCGVALTGLLDVEG